MAKTRNVTKLPVENDHQEIINSFRHLRKQLSPFLTPEYRKIMEQIENLASNQEISAPLYKVTKAKKLTKKELYYRLLNAKG